MRSTTRNILLAMAAKNGWHIHQGDFTSAFLNGVLCLRNGEAISKEQIDTPPIYTEQPPGYELDGEICLLYKALYGLKQASRIWYHTVHDYLVSWGFKTSKTDLGLFYCNMEDGKRTYLGIYIDDPLFVGNDLDQLLKLEEEIQ